MAIHDSAIEEYQYFLENYLFRLLGISHKSKDLVLVANTIPYQGFPFSVCDGILYFSTDKDTIFKLPYKDLTDDDKSLAINIIQAFFSVSKYTLTSSKKVVKHAYYSDIQKDANYRMAVQKGICNWIIGTKNDHVEHLFDILERWSVQTYEGKKVTFGFIINPEGVSDFGNDYGNWCDFLNDDFSAVLTDCIDSVIELDAKCNFIRYISLTDSALTSPHPSDDDYKLDDTLPFRFSEIIKKYVVNKSVGVFLLNNGDIIISKNQVIKFVKRNLNWLNFNFDAINNALTNFCEKHGVSTSLIRSIFASILDVSFAHTGGIISIVTDISQLTNSEKEEYPILNTCDFLQSPLSLDQIAEQIRNSKAQKGIDAEIVKKEIDKRLLKRKVIEKFSWRQKVF